MSQSAPPTPRERGPEWFTAGRVLLAAGLLLLCWLLSDVLLLVFAGVLIAVGLDGAASRLAARAPIGRGWALLLVSLVLFGALALVLGLLVPTVLGQARDVVGIVAGFVDMAQDWLGSRGWAEDLMHQVAPDEEEIAGMTGDMLGHLANYGLTTLGALASLVVLVALALFFAVNPALYRGGLLRLLPPDHRPRVDDAFSAVAHALRWWFLSQLASMAILGVTVGLGLWLIGVEPWLSLAVLTAVLTFVPYLGPIIAGIPVLIVGFTEGLQTGIIVAVFYVIVQNLEGAVLVPLIQQKAVDLAPALAISVQVLMGLAFGVAGFILAAPVTVVGMVLVQKLYIGGVLGERV